MSKQVRVTINEGRQLVLDVKKEIRRWQAIDELTQLQSDNNIDLHEKLLAYIDADKLYKDNRSNYVNYMDTRQDLYVKIGQIIGTPGWQLCSVLHAALKLVGVEGFVEKLVGNTETMQYFLQTFGQYLDADEMDDIICWWTFDNNTIDIFLDTPQYIGKSTIDYLISSYKISLLAPIANKLSTRQIALVYSHVFLDPPPGASIAEYDNIFHPSTPVARLVAEWGVYDDNAVTWCRQHGA